LNFAFTDSKTLQTEFETDTFNALNVGSSKNFVETVSELASLICFRGVTKHDSLYIRQSF
jgi:hypothetical protein